MDCALFIYLCQIFEAQGSSTKPVNGLPCASERDEASGLSLITIESLKRVKNMEQKALINVNAMTLSDSFQTLIFNTLGGKHVE